MPRHLVLRLEGPLLSFGAEAIDNFGVVRDFPAASMLVGLMANALGWRREDREAHQNLQDRLVFAARRDREGSRFTEFQTAQLDGGAQHWTTRGAVEGRRGGADTYKSPHLPGPSAAAHWSPRLRSEGRQIQAGSCSGPPAAVQGQSRRIKRGGVLQHRVDSMYRADGLIDLARLDRVFRVCRPLQCARKGRAKRGKIGENGRVFE